MRVADFASGPPGRTISDMKRAVEAFLALGLLIALAGCGSSGQGTESAPTHPNTPVPSRTQSKPPPLGPLTGISLDGAAKIFGCTHVTDLTDSGPFTGYITVNDYEFAGSCKKNDRTLVMFVYDSNRRQDQGAKGYLLGAFPGRLVIFNGLTALAANHREAVRLQHELGGTVH